MNDMYDSTKILNELEQNIFVKDVNSNYLFCNSHYAELLGETTTSIIGKDDYAFFPKEIAEKYRKDDAAVIKNEKEISVEEEIFINNEKRIVKTIKKPLYFNGKVTSVLGIFWDITEEKTEENNYKKLQSGLLQAQSLANIGHWELDLVSNKLYWSDEVFRIFGLKPQSFGATYEAFLSHIHPEDIGLVNDHYTNSISEKRGYHVIHRIIRKDGSIGYVEERCEHEFDDVGNVLRSIGTVHDITDKKEAKDELTLVYEVFARMTDGVIITDSSQRIIKINDAYTKMSGYKFEELMGERPDVLKSEMYHSGLYKEMWNEININGQWKGEMHAIKKSSEKYTIELSIIALHDNEGVLTNYIFIFNDITNRLELLNIINKQKDELSVKVEEKTKELQLLNNSLEETVREEIFKNKQKDAMVYNQAKLASMGEMIGNIAHQWRQPLNALGLVIQKIKFFHDNGMLSDDKIEGSVKKSMDLIDGMSNTIDDFRYFFNPDKEKEYFQVCEAINKAYSIVEPLFKNSSISFKLNADCDIKIEGYKNEFSQVILNILNNAKDILIEKEIIDAKVVVSVEIDAGYTVISIGDNGGGITETNLSKVFEPYFTTKEESKGTGIGLYMSKMIIEENHSGELCVINDDNGAVFTIKFKDKND